MSGKFDDRNRGGIWKNERKESDKHPDFTGSLNVDGKDYWVSAWRRRDGASDRSPALTFKVKPKDGKPMNVTRDGPPSRRGSMKDQYEGDDQEIPF